MRDHDEGVVVALGHGLDEGEDLLARAAVQVAGRLVREDDLRVGDQRPGNADALLLAAAHLGGLVVDVLGQAEVLEHLQRRGLALAHADPAIDQGHGHVLQRGHGGEEVELLEDEADVPQAEIHQLFFVHLLQVLPRDDDRAAGGLFQAGHHVEERGFAAARPPDDAHEFPGIDIQVHAVEGADPLLAHAVDLLQAPYADDGLQISTSFFSFHGRAKGRMAVSYKTSDARPGGKVSVP